MAEHESGGPASLSGVSSGLDTLAAITVTYNPSFEVLEAQLQQLPPESLKVWVDNSVDPAITSRLEALARGRADVVMHCNASNVGLAGALNLGVRLARECSRSIEWILLLDQDTETGENGVASLLDAATALPAALRAGCIGPRLMDVATGLEHGFHQISWCRWVRRYDLQTAVVVDNLNGSGTLMRCALFEELGGLDEDLFIDHVDTEWSFRVQSRGYALIGLPGVSFRHRMGERSIRFWFGGWRVWPYRSPLRHEFLFANTTRLLKRDYVPFCWKIWAPVKLAVTLVVHLLFDPARWLQASAMLAGVRRGATAVRTTR